MSVIHQYQHTITPRSIGSNSTSSDSTIPRTVLQSSGRPHRSSVPNVNIIIAHLKLMKCFQNLTQSIPKKDWTIFLRNSLRRFIWYVTLLKNKFKPRQRYSNEAAQLSNYKNLPLAKFCSHSISSQLPPIDILYVWYVLTSKTTSYYEMGARNSFLEFSFLPFPLIPVASSLSMNSFQYCPDKRAVQKFMAFTDNNIPYHWNLSSLQTVPIICPVCSQKLAGVYLKDIEGFSQLSSCRCKFQGQLCSSQLSKRQLYADLCSEKPLPFLYQTLSSHLFESETYDTTVEEIDISLKEILATPNRIQELKLASTTIETFFNSVEEDLESMDDKDIAFKIIDRLGKYYTSSSTSMLNATIPASNPIQITEGWNIFETRNELIEKISSLKWLYNPQLENVLLPKSIARYGAFFHILSDNYRCYSLVPLVDIDLVWQTHKLAVHSYMEHCKIKCHNNVIDAIYDTSKLASNFEYTCKLYKTVYHKEYSSCNCYYCFRAGRLIKQSQYSPKIAEFCTLLLPCFTISNCSTTTIPSR
ncbi:hypothetical protein CAAN1_02S06480 [[Candida] anglica]|uniref:Uncharacterized protein n=1 Tax=[Candida] anglica TaxID=148631 RepID=A0ABP0EDW9_9ASCO